MSPEQASRASATDARRALWIRIASVGLIAVAGLSYLRDLEFADAVVPMAPLSVSPDLRVTARLPAKAGILKGHNLVVVTLDTTRPDRLGCYGNRAIQTPTLDRLAERGAIFSRAVATAPMTLPTHASIFTGLYPHHHGARTNGLFHLDPEHQTLAEILSSHGYQTAAVVSSFVLDARFGLAQGFDHYDDRLGTVSGQKEFAERPGDQSTDLALDWLRTRRDNPFFLWIHYIDPHASYRPPEPFAGENDLAYDGEIAFVDNQLGRLLETVESQGDRETLIVVVGDHGEGLGEHGELTHGFLAQEATMRVPLIFYAPAGIPEGIHVNSLASQIDLMPTVLSLLGIAKPDGLDGVDLATVVAPDRAVIAEAVEGRANFGWSSLTALYQGSLKYIDGPSPKLFDLKTDPIESRDIHSVRSADAMRLRRKLATMRDERADILEPSSVELSDTAIAQLEALGYLVNTSQRAGASNRDIDPNDMLPLLNELSRMERDSKNYSEQPIWRRLLFAISGHEVQRNPTELIVALEQMAAAHPDFAPVHHALYRYYRQEGRLDEAERAAARRDEVITMKAPS